MNDRPPNQIARVIAVGGVAIMFVLIIAVIAISAGGSGDDGGSGGSGNTSTTAVSTKPSIRKAIAKGEYEVKTGDTLTSIAEETGIDVDTLVELNPDTDPQVLVAGTTIKLK